MRPFLPLIIWCCLAATSFGQVASSAETRYVVSGIDGYEILGGQVLVPEDSVPRLLAVGVVKIECTASIKRVKASNSKREPVAVEKIDNQTFLILGSGKVWVEITCVDFEQQIFDQDEQVIEIGNSPAPPEPPEPDEPDNPDPQPTPDVPEEYQELAVAVSQSLDAANVQIDLRQRVGEVYDDVADKMKSFDIKRSSDAVAELSKKLKEFTFGSEWDAAFKLIDADGKQRGPLTFVQTIAWLRAVAVAFRGI